MAESDKTQPATPHKRKEARNKGQVAKSMEFNTVFVLMSTFLALRFLSPFIFQNL
jgi:flagellar biosynthetic protein FlhB